MFIKINNPQVKFLNFTENVSKKSINRTFNINQQIINRKNVEKQKNYLI